MHDDADDQRLLQAYAAGDARAFELLYQRHEQALYRFVRRLLGQQGSGLVDEVFQDTWLRLVQARSTWRAQGAQVRTWLFTIAHHRAVDVLRRCGREVGLPEDAAEASGPTPSEGPDGADPSGSGAWAHWPPAPVHLADPEHLHFWRKAGQRLLHCLEGLPLPQRAAFLLQHEEGLSVAELAQHLGVGFETAKTRLRYAMAKLRPCMGAYALPDDPDRSTPAA